MPQTAVARFVLRWMLVPVLLLWAYHLAQRRYARTVGAKRYATMYLTLLLLAAWLIAYAFVRFGVGDAWLLAVAAALAGVAVWQRRRLFPYRLRCVQCAKPLGLVRILFRGDNTCEACAPDRDDDAPRPDDAPRHDDKETLP